MLVVDLKEMRYRQRYLDLIANDQTHETFKTRHKVQTTLRYRLLAWVPLVAKLLIHLINRSLRSSVDTWMRATSSRSKHQSSHHKLVVPLQSRS
jgi:hypothetical protein